MKEDKITGEPQKSPKEKRKLVAIMFIDIVGYTTLMSKDEQKTLKLLQKYRNTLKPMLKKFNGEWLKEIGDGALVSFESAVEAVRCALETQKAFKDKPNLKLRIGIHIGDVVFSRGDIFGDGVNVASRIEPLAEAGGICVTKHVYDKIKNFPDIKTKSMGPQKLKNVAEALEVYKVHTGEAPVKAKEAAAEVSQVLDSIAVLPFSNISTDPEQEYFCDGIAEEIINALTHLEGLRVVARTSTFVFKDKIEDIRDIGKKLNVATVLEGSVRKAGKRLRITAQLINVADGYYLWSEKFDRDMEDIFAIQDEISLSIVDKLKVKPWEKEKTAVVKHHTEDLEAYNLYLQGRYFWKKRSEKGMTKGIEYFNKAIEKDSNYALAYAGLADSYNTLHVYLVLSHEEAYKKAKEAATRALELDDTLGEAHASMGSVKLIYENDLEGAEQEYKRAIELNPGYASAHHWYAMVLVEMHRLKEAETEGGQALQLDPLSPTIKRFLADVKSRLGDWNGAEGLYKRALEMDASDRVTHALYAEFLARIGRTEEGMTKIQCLLKQIPNEVPVNVVYGAILYYARQYDKAIKHMKKVVKMAPFSVDAHAYLGSAYVEKGRYEEALQELQKIKKFAQGRELIEIEGMLGAIYAKMGKKEEARKALKNLIKRSKQEYVSPVYMAQINFALGENDKGIEWLEKAYEERAAGIEYLKVSPWYDNVRSDPRFTALLKQMRLGT